MKRLSAIVGPDLYRELGRDAEAKQVLRQVIAESPSRIPDGTHSAWRLLNPHRLAGPVSPPIKPPID
jgi:hypothetical protein